MMQSETFIKIPVERLRHIGPRKAKALEKVGIKNLEDLLYYFPRRYLDRSAVFKINHLRADIEATVIGKVVNSGIKKGRRNRFILIVYDGTDYMSCVWFSRLAYWQRVFHQGEWLALSGKVGHYGGWQMVHPEFDRLGQQSDKETLNTLKIIPLYSSTEQLVKLGLDSRGFRQLISGLLKKKSDSLAETLPQSLLQRFRLVSLEKTMQNIHFPDSFTALRQARRRLKFEELFYMQLYIALHKNTRRQSESGISFRKVGDLVRVLVESLSFELTLAQKRILHEIHSDMKSEKPMNRLLQGDVGSGKTIVAVISMLIAVENGYQAALMAPTEILAEQHYFTLCKRLQPVGVDVVLLIGGQNRSDRTALLQKIESGKADIVIGTHALIQEKVDFQKLGLVIVDEQHRFGVMQRAVLRQKGMNPDVLVMTATPIPRTLSMTVYGDLDVSVLDEMPAGRKPVRTRWITETKRAKAYRFLRQRIAEGAQAYIVFPLVEETEKSDLKAATDSFKAMQETFFKAFKLGLLHGRMKSEEKEAVMSAFKAGDLDVLVSTTVVEVGVDVPNATLMVVEHAERFGLTQMHQLRGRVGRGSKQSFCILISYGELNDQARKRLQTMAASNDGFEIAQVDLEIRGPGEFFGARQSGFANLRIADLLRDVNILKAAREEAFTLINDKQALPYLRTLFQRSYFARFYRDKIDFTLLNQG